MIATASDSIWTYLWTVSGSTVSSTTATVSGTDLLGNPYSGTESLTFIIDNTLPAVTLTDTESDNIVLIQILVHYRYFLLKAMAATPTISLSGVISNAYMTPINGVELLNSSLWLNNEPNHLNTLEDYGEIQNGKLNDIPNGVNNSAIIEFSDNRSSTLTNYTYVGSYQGHSYYTRNSGAHWNVCKDEAISFGGSLFIINKDAEFNYVKSVISNIDYHIGFYQDTNDVNYSPEPNGGWKWIGENTSWNYTWTVSTTLNSVTATVSGTDLAGNTYSGTDSITLMVDNIPTVTLTDTDSDNVVSDSDEVTITAHSQRV